MDLFSIISSILCILTSILITWFFSAKFKIKKQIIAQFNNDSVFEYNEKLPQELEILYKNIKIERLNKMTIALWNNGSTEIRKEDNIKSDLLRIKVEQNALILSTSIIKVSNPDCNFRLLLSEDRTTVFIIFDYLNCNDGIVFTILHNDMDNPKVSGNFIGLNEKINVSNLTSRKYRLRLVALIVTSTFFIIACFVIDTITSKSGFNNRIEAIVKIILIIILLLVYIRIILPQKKKLPPSLKYKDI